MKRRTKRDLGILLGVIVILAGIVLFNSTVNRSALAAQMEKWRTAVEQERMAEGLRLLDWDLMRATKGRLRSGGEFREDLIAMDGRTVNIIGFMVPLEEFRAVHEFLLLPLPIECYFCEIPPARDVMLVSLKEGETAEIYDEPVLINGVLNIHQGPDQKFFYSITNAGLGPGEEDGSLNPKRLELEHMLGGPEHGAPQEELIGPISPGNTD